MVAVSGEAALAEPALRITEIFLSLQGEARTAGLPTVFVRLTGCPLRCHYCDTAYAFTGGHKRLLSDVLDEVATHRVNHVCVTGGEPLAQPGCLTLLSRLCDQGYSVSLETSGALDIAPVDAGVSRVLDLKTPASGECDKNLWSNIDALTPHDQIKFVICDRNDFDWAVERVKEYRLTAITTVWMSPSHDAVEPGVLADWIIESGQSLRLQVQLHKYLWGDVRGR